MNQFCPTNASNFGPKATVQFIHVIAELVDIAFQLVLQFFDVVLRSLAV